MSPSLEIESEKSSDCRDGSDGGGGGGTGAYGCPFVAAVGAH
jgi:hypothetical protein